MFRNIWVGLGALGLVLSGCGPTLTQMSAGQVGCVESDIEISDASHDLSGSETWVATCNGARFVCSKVRTGTIIGKDVSGSVHQVNCTPEGGGGGAESAQAAAAKTAPVEAPKNATLPPEGAAGFLFGTSVADSSQVCTNSGQDWSALEATKFQCDGLPEDIGLEGRAVLSFCGGQLCGIELITEPEASGKSFTGSFMSLSDALDKKYGVPEKREMEIPAECRDKSVLARCLTEGSAHLLRSWAWTSGERITMTLGVTGEASALALRLVYTRRPSGFRPNTDAL